MNQPKNAPKILAKNPLQIADYRTLLVIRTLNSMMTSAQALLVGWQVYQLTHQVIYLGYIGLAEALPAIATAFFSGHIVDNNRPFRILIASLIGLTVSSIILWLTTLTSLGLNVNTQLLVIFLCIGATGAARAFFPPVFFSIVPKIVPRELFTKSSALNSGSYQLASITGPALAGLVYARWGAPVAFLGPCLLLLFSLCYSFTLSDEIKSMQNHNEREPILKSMRKGLDFVFKERVVLGALSLDMFSVLFGGAIAVLPAFADQVLHVGSEGLGLLRAAPAIGSGLVALTLGVGRHRSLTGGTLLFVVAGFGFSTLAFAYTQSLPWALVTLGLTGAFDGISMVIRGTILQLRTPDNMRGRVSSINSIFITSSNEIGAFESGTAAYLMGLVPSIAFGGVMTVLIVGLTALLVPEIRRAQVNS